MARISDATKTKIREERKKGLSLRKIAEKFEVHHSTISGICTGISKPETSNKDFNPSNPMVRSDALKFIQRKKKTGFTTDSLAKKLEATLENTKKVIQYLSHHDGYNILNQGHDRWQLVSQLPEQKPLELSRLTGKEYKFGLVSDTHLNNENERLDVLEAAYNEFARQGLTDVFHAGNIIDGEFRFNKYEIKNWGIHNQAQYVADVYPQRKNITTHFITGTCHEGWYQDSSGLKVGWYIQKVCEDAGRDDMIHLGHIERDIIFKQPMGETKVRIMHPGGGCAYALSYPGQKMVESFQGGEKPHMLILGHYHKFNVNYAREITTIMAGCFHSEARITTDQGLKKICQIQVGDSVLTHKNRYKKVTKLFKRKYTGDWVTLHFGRKGNYRDAGSRITATSEHPILVIRNNVKEWIAIKDIEIDDTILINSTNCKGCGATTPYYMNYCKNCNPSTIQAENRRKKGFITWHERNRENKRFDHLNKINGKPVNKKDSKHKHFVNDIQPFCEKKKQEGAIIIPVGGPLIPDAIEFKDGKVILHELERGFSYCNTSFKDKYKDTYMIDYVDDINWILLKKQQTEYKRSWYEPDESGFVRVKVVHKQINPSRSYKRKSSGSVYNFEVEDDNSYVAGNVVVHNCLQDQTGFMRKNKLAAHVGFIIVTLGARIDGTIGRCNVEFFPFYDRKYHRKLNSYTIEG